jgi:hypothetical protein
MSGETAFRFERKTSMRLSASCCPMGVDMRGVNVKTPTLEDVFLKLTGRSLRE